MITAMAETFISEYFLIKAVLGKYLTDSKELFIALSKICLIPETDVSKLYDLVENDTAKSINTEKEFMQHQRIQKYSKLVGTEKKSNVEWEEVARIKGNAILTAKSCNLVMEAEISRNMVYTNLSTAAASGRVIAMQIMGILQCEGIFLEKNEKAGIKNLSKSAYWNDSVSILALLYYSEDNHAYNVARLRKVIEGSPFAKLYEVAAKRYGVDENVDVREVKLLYKAFNSGVLKREEYNRKYARILNSKALYVKDKEKVVFTQSQELISIIGDLPLKLSHEKITAIDVDAIKKMPIKRENETSAIVRALKNGDLRELPSYRPLCICSDSKYLLNMYAKAIATKNKTTHVEMINVGELIEYDFEPSTNNVFVRSIDENKDNRFFLFFNGEISERKFDAIKCILQSNRRAKFYLNNPSVTLNLCTVLPICFCDVQNARFLELYCDIVRLASMTTDELPLAVKEILASKEKTYGVDKIKLMGKACDVFSGYDIDMAERLIDAAVRDNREKGATITLTHEILQNYTLENDRPRIGFGGFTNGRI